MKSLFFFLSFIALGNSISVVSELDTTEGFIGDVFTWSIIVNEKSDKTYNFPELKIKNENISLKDYRLISDDEQKLVGIEFMIVNWDTGRYKTPNYSIEILNKNGSIDYSISIDPIDFRIASIISNNKKNDYKDIKGPISVKPLIPFEKIIYVTVLIILVICIMVVWRKRIKTIHKKIDYSIVETPKDRALRRIKELDSSKMAKDNYFLLSHIIRQYIESKYFIRTLEMTTKEIDSLRDLIPLENIDRTDLINFLYIADTVKYARETPTINTFKEHKKKIESLLEKI